MGPDPAAQTLFNPTILRNRTLRAGLTSFFFQCLLQAGLFFTIPLFLSVALGLSAVATGVRLMPLSLPGNLAPLSRRKRRHRGRAELLVRSHPLQCSEVW